MTWEETKAALVAQCVAKLSHPEIARQIMLVVASDGSLELVVTGLELTLRAKSGAP